MGRKPRIHFPGAVYHLIIRGNAHQDVFYSDQDRCRFLLFLQETTERFKSHVHSFCLMPNHVHMAIQVGDLPLSVIMQSLSSRYTRWINKKRDRIGHLFHGRYKAVLVDSDSYLLQLIAYIHLNPIRAGISGVAEDYVWSSHRAYLGIETVPWLETDLVLSQFGDDRGQALLRFASFVSRREGQGHIDDFYGRNEDRRILGGENFVRKVIKKGSDCSYRKPSLDVVLAAVCKMCGVTESALAASGQGRDISEVRAIAAWAVLELSGDHLSALGTMIGRDVSSLSSACKRLRKRVEDDMEVASRMERIRQEVENFATLQS